MATAELRQILDAPAEATAIGDTNVMALDEVAQALGVSLTSRKLSALPRERTAHR